MTPSPGKPRLRFVPTIAAALLFFAALAATYVLFMGRKPGVFRSESIISITPDFYTHVSNFTISYVLVAGIGYVWLMMGVRMRPLFALAATVVVANLVYEGFIPLLNTPDMVDAYYGIAGVVLACGLLAWIKRFGLRPSRYDAEA